MSKKVTIHQLIWYFVIFSVIGLIVETTFGFITTGKVDSRKGFILGPFCPIYGLGACVFISVFSKINYESKSKGKRVANLFFLGIVLGMVLEYILSFAMEALYGTRFWDYSFVKWNVNGRICLTYGVYWGALTLVLMEYIKPAIDKWIAKLEVKHKNIINAGMILFLIVDALLTMWANMVYKNRANSKIYGTEYIPSSNQWIYFMEEKFFRDERMKFIFPNLRIRDKHGKEVFVRNVL